MLQAALTQTLEAAERCLANPTLAGLEQAQPALEQAIGFLRNNPNSIEPSSLREHVRLLNDLLAQIAAFRLQGAGTWSLEG